MQPFRLGTVLVFSTVIVGIFGGEGCLKDFKNLKDVEAAVDKCKTKLNLKDGDVMMPAELVKSGFEDKCLVKCIMTEMKYGKDDGTIDMKLLEDDFKKNAPSGKADALIALMKDCADTTAKDATIMKDSCKAIAKTKVCYIMGQDKICAPA